MATGIKSKRLHQLRKDGKELRYLLEAFSDLYGQRLVAPLVGDLKNLQNTLGIVCDLDVQREMILEMVSDKRACLPGPTAKALRRWAVALQKRRRAAKKECAGPYARLMCQRNREALKLLIGDANP